jgi:hypothetical protein
MEPATVLADTDEVNLELAGDRQQAARLVLAYDERNLLWLTLIDLSSRRSVTRSRNRNLVTMRLRVERQAARAWPTAREENTTGFRQAALRTAFGE